MIVECANPDCQLGEGKRRKCFEPKRVRKRNFCSGACRTMYSRASKRMVNSYHSAIDAINDVNHFTTTRDDLKLDGNKLMIELNNKLTDAITHRSIQDIANESYKAIRMLAWIEHDNDDDQRRAEARHHLNTMLQTLDELDFN